MNKLHTLLLTTALLSAAGIATATEKTIVTTDNPHIVSETPSTVKAAVTIIPGEKVTEQNVKITKIDEKHPSAAQVQNVAQAAAQDAIKKDKNSGGTTSSEVKGTQADAQETAKAPTPAPSKLDGVKNTIKSAAHDAKEGLKSGANKSKDLAVRLGTLVFSGLTLRPFWVWAMKPETQSKEIFAKVPLLRNAKLTALNTAEALTLAAVIYAGYKIYQSYKEAAIEEDLFA